MISSCDSLCSLFQVPLLRSSKSWSSKWSDPFVKQISAIAFLYRMDSGQRIYPYLQLPENVVSRQQKTWTLRIELFSCLRVVPLPSAAFVTTHTEWRPSFSTEKPSYRLCPGRGEEGTPSLNTLRRPSASEEKPLYWLCPKRGERDSSHRRTTRSSPGRRRGRRVNVDRREYMVGMNGPVTFFSV